MKTNPKVERTATIIFILCLTSTALFALIPTVAANTPTYAFLTVSPNPVGVNQEAALIMWLDKIDPTTAGPQGSVWQGFQVLITKPDGTTVTLGPFKADPAAFAYSLYTPDQVGTYTLKFTFPGQQVTGLGAVIPIPINEYYEPSSFTTTLTVQKDPIAPLPQTPLPKDFWTRPIDAQNQDWYTISGNWLGTGATTFGNTAYSWSGNFNPYSKAPNSAHIVWRKPITLGGLIGGEYGGTSTSNYYTGKSYEPKFQPPVIINGVLYYNEPDAPKTGFYAVDLRTGETLWRQNSSGPVTQMGLTGLLGYYGYAGITCGQILKLANPNEEGGRGYLWYMGLENGLGSPAVYKLYDAATGQWILSFKNAIDGGTRIVGPNGEMLVYFLDGTFNWLALWNSTKAIGAGGESSTSLWTWRPQVGAEVNWQDGIQWNVTVPPIFGQAIYQIDSGTILATTGNIFLPQNWQMEAAYDAQTGKSLWVENRTTPPGITTFGLMGPLKDGVYAEFDKGAMQWRGYSVSNGKEIWGPSEPYSNAWGSQPSESLSAYGNIYQVAIDGIHALDLSTGKKLWDFNADISGSEFPGFSTYPFLAAMMTVADGKVFAATGNSHGDPLFRGAKLYAIDANSGKQVWNINGFFLDTMPVADGYLVGFNGYDNSIYCFGKGQTATTVTAMPGVGNTVTVQGTVTDQSPGKARGTAAISDASMTAWMEYLYMQKSKPEGATGVPVEVKATSSSGQTTSLGTVISDSKGQFKVAWTPPTNDLYTITAAFAGSESYFSSEAETALSVNAVGSTAPTPTAGGLSIDALGMYIIAATAIIVIAIAIVAVLLLRRKA